MLETVITEGRLRVVVMARGLRQMSPTERELLRRILRLAKRISDPIKVDFDLIRMSIQPDCSAEELLKVIQTAGEPIELFK